MSFKHVVMFILILLVRMILPPFSPLTSLRDLLLLQCLYFSSINSTDGKNLDILYSEASLFFWTWWVSVTSIFLKMSWCRPSSFWFSNKPNYNSLCNSILVIHSSIDWHPDWFYSLGLTLTSTLTHRMQSLSIIRRLCYF